MRKVAQLCIGGLLLPLVVAAQESDLQRQHQADVTQKLLERTTQDHEQCKRDWADIWVQARQLSMAYQRLDQEMKALKETKTKEEASAVGQEAKPPGNGATP
jgi:hypothetical protein